MTPQLALSYSSSTGYGQAGVGWSVAGFGSIVREGEDGGAPGYNARDRFRLDGAELLPCTAGNASPSCTAGGTHATRIESYRRIRRAGTSWQVDAPSGVRSVYAPVIENGHGIYRWGLVSRSDLLGNEVRYSWQQLGGGATADTYPSEVRYGGYRVTLYWEWRPDRHTYLTGSYTRRTAYRLRSVIVELDEDPAVVVRGYALGYDTSPVSGRSRLVSVRRYGRDLVADRYGFIVRGSALAPWTFRYGEDEAFDGFDDRGAWLSGFCDATDKLETGDFNGDGRTDVLCYTKASGRLQVALSTGEGFDDRGDWANPWCTGSSNEIFFSDFDGDGKTDTLCHHDVWDAPWTEVRLSTGEGFAPASTWASSWCRGHRGWSIGDLDGDGRSDFFCRKLVRDDDPSMIWGLSTGSSFEELPPIRLGCDGPLGFGDFNGDGKSDAFCEIAVWPSNGRGFDFPGFVALGVGDRFCRYEGSRVPADWNGDGATDVVCQGDPENRGRRRMYLSTGRSFYNWGLWTEGGGCRAPAKQSVGDFNGDGLNDLLCNAEGTPANDIDVELNTGHSFAPRSTWLSGWCGEEVALGDWNGDGKTDLLCTAGGEQRVALAGSVAGASDLLVEAVSPLGGTTLVGYVPGTHWPHLQLATTSCYLDAEADGFAPSLAGARLFTSAAPTVLAVTVLDGRGGEASTHYTYGDGRYDREEKLPLGFGFAFRHDPTIEDETAGPVTETVFRQDIALAGTPEWSARRGGEGKLLAVSSSQIAVTGDGRTTPFVVRLDGAWQQTFDGSVAEPCSTWPCAEGERRYQAFDHDAYGNRTATYDHGNYDVEGDETVRLRTYTANLDAYLLDRVANEELVAGPELGGARLSATLYYYDGATTPGQTPSLGLLTQTLRWLDTEDRYVAGCPSGVCRAYDAYGNLVKTIDPAGAETTFIYGDAYHIYPTETINALGHRTETEWNGVCGQPDWIDNANEQRTFFDYDPLCRPVAIRGPLGTSVVQRYVEDGDPTAQYVETAIPGPGGVGEQWRREYLDGLGRVYRVEEVVPAPHEKAIVQELEFDARGQVARSAAPHFPGEPAQWIVRTYDSRGRLLSTTFPDSAVEKTIYGPRSVTTIDPEGRRKTVRGSADGRMGYEDEFLNGRAITTTTRFDLRGLPVEVTDAVGNRWSWRYDSLGRKREQIDPDAGQIRYEYDHRGLFVAQTDALGQRTELEHDLLGRLLTKTVRAGTPAAEVVRHVYDEERPGHFNVGALTTVRDPFGTVEINFDAAGRQVEVIRKLDGVRYNFHLGFDGAGRTIAVTYPDGERYTYEYDIAGRVKALPGVVLDTEYDAAGQLRRRYHVDGTVTERDYSPQRGWLDAIRTISNGGVLQSLVYERDLAGRIEIQASPFAGESWRYRYDELGRLVEAHNLTAPERSQSWEYDDTGNMIFNSRLGTYIYPPPGSPRPHAVTEIGGARYRYDENGNMTESPRQTLDWDGDNRPVRIGTTRYVYDASGARVKKIAADGRTTRYVSADYEIDPDGVVTKRLGPAKKVGGTLSFPHVDHLDSIQAISGGTGGELQRYRYQPFGERETASSEHRESRGWIGQHHDDESGLVYLNARYYDPEIGRFLSPDPIARSGQGLNRYSYARNDPINLSDPTGLAPECKFVQEVCWGGTPENDFIDDKCTFVCVDGPGPKHPRPFSDPKAFCEKYPLLCEDGEPSTCRLAPETCPDEVPTGATQDPCEQDPPPEGCPDPPTRCEEGTKAKKDCPGGFRFRDVVDGINDAVNDYIAELLPENCTATGTCPSNYVPSGPDWNAGVTAGLWSGSALLLAKVGLVKAGTDLAARLAATSRRFAVGSLILSAPSIFHIDWFDPTTVSYSPLPPPTYDTSNWQTQGCSSMGYRCW